MKKQGYENMILMDKFHSIDEGKGLQVGKADFMANFHEIHASPVFQENSLNKTSRKLQLREIDRQN